MIEKEPPLPHCCFAGKSPVLQENGHSSLKIFDLIAIPKQTNYQTSWAMKSKKPRPKDGALL
jgi:hypothetical protein